jgi:uncharacterized protein YjbJ (UPF0337 family)
MGLRDKARNKAEEVKGKGKEKVGKATDDKDLQAEGAADRVKGNVKQAAEKVKDAFRRK